ncbi:MAG: acyltransferase family protein [Bryobacteraceae bacterium]|nr:acyltransferase family protein [Bryobacteraceae bacterium]
MGGSQPSREHGLDWLRVFAFGVLILYHSGMIFVSWPFHIKNPETSPALESVMLFFNRWRLPLLFFISGCGVWFSLRRRSYVAFLQERWTRLFVPLAVAIFVIVPPQIYFERLFRGASLSYAEFYPTVFEFVSYPQGNTSWHHMWFVAYILVFCTVCIPVFAFFQSKTGRSAAGWFAAVLERRRFAIYLVNVPNVIAGIVLGPRWPTTHNLLSDWANFTGSLLTFLWGFVFASDRRLLDVVTRRRREFLVAGIGIAVLFFTLRATQALAGLPPDWRIVAGNLVSGYFGMTWIFALLGYARAHFDHGTPALRYATEAVYPFYIVHQTITIAIGYYAIQWQMNLWAKLAIVAAVTFFGSWACYEAVRRIPFARPLFGLKAESSVRNLQRSPVSNLS